MQETHANKNSNDFDDEIDLQELFYALLEKKWIIVSLTSFVSIIGVIYSLLLPNIYESKALLVPISSSSSISSALRDYSALSGIAGISIPSVGNQDNYVRAIPKINSLSFFENSIMPNIYLPDLMAVKSWDAKTNTLFFDNSIYDMKSNTWVRDHSYNEKQIPSSQESYEVFKTKHLNFIEDRKAGIFTLSIKHQSPFIAKQWTELVVSQINNFYRLKDKSEIEKRVSYLNNQISITSLTEVKQVLAQLIQTEFKKLAILEANEYYVFDYIDPPKVMEKKSGPKRALIAILSALFGGIFSTLFVIIRHYIMIGKTKTSIKSNS